MISNVPGPAFPLYFAGMELRAVYPLGPVIDGVALNVTVQSYRDSLFVGINACATRRARPAGPDAGHGGRAGALSRMAAGAGEPHRVRPARLAARGPRPGPAPGRSPQAPPTPTRGVRYRGRAGWHGTARCARVAPCSGRTWRATPSRSHRGC